MTLLLPEVLLYMNQRLSGRIAIITGGAKGIGLVTAHTFLQQGATVSIWDIDREGGNRAIQAWRSEGYRCSFHQVDTTKEAQIAEAADAVLAEFGSIDILINNAGITRDSSMKKMSLDQWNQVIDVNLTGVFLCTKVIAPLMTRSGWGRILNASSVVALYGNFGQTNYVAAKSGLIGMTKVWAREYGPKGITVNAVAPGFIDTDMITTIPQENLDQLLAHTPLKRIGRPEDIANAYAFLASEEASFITGVTLSVDGGLVV